MKNTSLTRSGIAYDLKLSPYKSKVYYDSDYYVTFIFSSELYMSKFEERIKEHRKIMNEKISKRHGYKITNNIVSDIKLYTLIEKRGFLMRSSKDNKNIECLEKAELNGVNLIAKS